MKKILLILIAILALTLLVGCNDSEYEPVESTEEEARVVLTFECDGKEYEVKYELYRALFLGNKNLVDGGDDSAWSGEGASENIKKINDIICARAYEIYSTIHVAKTIGYDAYSREADKKIDEYIKGAIEGDDTQIGHGSYENYLESLKANNLNYSVATLLMRYSLAQSAVNTYFAGYEHEAFGNMQGDYKYTEDDVRNYYYSGECARVIEAYIPEGVRNKAWVSSFRDDLIAAKSESDMAVMIISSTTANEADLLVDGKISGMVIGKSSLDTFFYDKYLEEVFSAKASVMGEIFKLTGTEADGYYMIYGLEKSDEHFERCYEQIRLSYIDNVIGSRIGAVTEQMRSSSEFTDVYDTIVHKDITME